MIIQLYTFAPGSFVVAEEWNSNFRALYNTNLAHIEAIADANSTIAFPNSDLTSVFNAVSSQPNSFAIPGNSINISPECEYYKILGSGEDLVINIPTGFNAECRILIQIQENRSLLPFSVSYAGTTIINHYDSYNITPGYYYIMIHESNLTAQVKLIWTGVQQW